MRLLVVAIGSVILFFPTYALFQAAVGPDWGGGIAAVALFIAFPVLALRLWVPRDPPAAASMEQALRDGLLATADYDVTEAVAVADEADEDADEGLVYLLSVGEGRTLCLSGQYLADAVERGAFPSTRIRILWHQSEGFTYGVQCLGSPLAATTAPRRVQRGDQPAFEDRQVMDRTLSSLVAGAS